MPQSRMLNAWATPLPSRSLIRNVPLFTLLETGLASVVSVTIAYWIAPVVLSPTVGTRTKLSSTFT